MSDIAAFVPGGETSAAEMRPRQVQGMALWRGELGYGDAKSQGGQGTLGQCLVFLLAAGGDLLCGVDGTSRWNHRLFGAEGMRPGSERWVEAIAASKDIWLSQTAAIRALVPHRGSPQKARSVTHKTFAGGRATQVGAGV